jgi:hypothetical protein
MKQVLFFLSVIAHPVFLPLITFILWRNEPFQILGSGYTVSLLWIILLSLIAPFLYFYKFRPEVSIIYPTMQDRTSIYLTFSLLYSVLTLLIFLFTPYIAPTIFAYFLIAFFLLIISLFDLKWSWHTAGIGTFTGLFFMQFMNGRILWAKEILPFLITISIAIIIIRKIQKAHNWQEVIFGFLLGFVLPLIIFYRTLL